MKNNLKIALIGTGYWGRNLARVIQQSEHAELVSVTDLQPENFSNLASQHSGLKAFTDYRKAIDDNNTDAVVIVTPISTHFEIAQYALQCGKHVLCEKVLCTETEQEEMLWNLADSAGKILMVDFTFLHNSAVKYVKNSIAQKQFGKIYNITMKRLGYGPIRKDVDVITDLATHDLSMLHYWLGKPQWANVVTQCLMKKDKADAAFIQLGFANNVAAAIHVSWLNPLKQREIVITGQEQMMVFDDVHPTEKIRIVKRGKEYYTAAAKDFGSFQTAIKDGDIIIPNIPYPEPLSEMFLQFIEKIHSSAPNAPERSMSLDVLESLELIKSCQREVNLESAV